MPSGLPLCLLAPSLKRNPRVGLTVTYLEVGGLGIQLIFNENIIKPGDNKEYIKEAANIIVIFHTKRGCDCKGDILVYLKISLN